MAEVEFTNLLIVAAVAFTAPLPRPSAGAAAAFGIELGLIDAATGAGLVAAGLLSVLLFPLAALIVLRGGEPVTSASTASLTDIAPHTGGTA